MAALQKEVQSLRHIHDSGSVNTALALLRQHLARPRGIFDLHAALAALEQLVDVARDKRVLKANHFAVVSSQSRPLLYNHSFQHFLLNLVGDKEEVEIAKDIQKALKTSSAT